MPTTNSRESERKRDTHLQKNVRYLDCISDGGVGQPVGQLWRADRVVDDGLDVVGDEYLTQVVHLANVDIKSSIHRGIYCAFQSFFVPPLSEESFFPPKLFF